MIVVFGSLNVDITVPVKELPMPGETVLGPTYTMAPGGKGANQALAAKYAGAEVFMVGKTGQDSFAEPASAMLREGGVDVSRIEKDPHKPTACALIIVDETGRNQIAVASGANLQAMAEQVKDDWLTPDSLLVLQMEVSNAENWKLIRRAKSKKTRILLNVAPAGEIPQDIFPLLDWLIVNEIEVLAVARQLGFDGVNPFEAARYIHAKIKITIIVTLGAEGVQCFSSEGVWKVPALAVHAIDTTAAGDSFVGAFAASLDSGNGLGRSLMCGAIAGSLACMTYGAQTSVPRKKEIEEQLHNIDFIVEPAEEA